MLNTKSSENQTNELKKVDLDDSIHSIENLLQVRSKLPKQLDRFPFNRFKILERWILKVFELLFRDQRKINDSLLEALALTKKSAQQMAQQAQESAEKTAQQMAQQAQESAEQTAQRIAQQAQGVAEQAAQREAELKQEVLHLKKSISKQQRLFDLLVSKPNTLFSTPVEKQQLKEILDENSHILDSFYLAFEDKFRGTREDIKNRVKVYLPIMEQVYSSTQDFSILDIGCGRGEWLELLKESGYMAHGVDMNNVMVEQCLERELDVREGDAIEYLRSQSDASLGAVTGMHIIEHLPFKVIIQLLDETLRVLKPGGVAIFETPNPQNILVGSCNFYMDPTHLNPLPSPMIHFMAEERGFDRVEILNLHPIEENSNQKLQEISEFLFQLFYGAQDYALIGYKQ